MGLVNQTITFTAGIKPTASQWTNQFTTLYNLVNGQIDSANVDKTSSDGIMVLDTAQTRTATLTMSTAGLVMSGAISASAWGTTGVVYSQAAATYTDSSTAGSGTATNATFASFAQPTLAATNSSVTTTNAATVYIANAPTAGTNQTITNAYALWVDAGNARFDGTVTMATGSTIGNLTLSDGSITDSSGAISFGNENLTTTGTLSAGATTVTSLNASDGNITNVGDIALDSISSDAGSSITVTLGTDAGDDFKINNGADMFLAEGDKSSFTFTLAGTTNGIYISQDGVLAANQRGLYLYSNGAHTNSNTQLALILNDNASSTNPALRVDNAGSGNVVEFLDGGTNAFRVTGTGNTVIGNGAIATTATDGFLYIPSCAGAPTGTPTDISNTSAIVHDTTNNRIYLYDHVSNAWQYAALT